MSYIITNKTDRDLAWSNTYGWCDQTFDTFTEKEQKKLSLPLDGEWMRVPWYCKEENSNE